MPKRTDLKRILLLGSGPIVIGQACEFDYSGTQACKALMEEGYEVILVNSNPATIMTDPHLATTTYVEPVHWEIVANIIKKERPQALLPTMGGQTALNCALDLDHHGVLKAYNVEMIGASRQAIDKAEDREKFRDTMKSIGLDVPRSAIAHSLEEAMQVQANVGYPTIIRPSFTLGGSGSGIAYNKEEFIDICERGLELSPTHELLIEESLIGWKEFELEIMRDCKGNCIIVCSIENVDPMGIHTGDSITVAPVQTLTDKEYQRMRDMGIRVMESIGITSGGSNVQFGLDPKTGRMVVIEMNPRVSRSSALASKATGYPIAKMAAKLAIGKTLDECMNEITRNQIPASFEPSIDYTVVKIPRFNFDKFPQAEDRLTTQMKSVGEVMAIGSHFQEALLKAIRGLEYKWQDLQMDEQPDMDLLLGKLRTASSERLWHIALAFRRGLSVQDIAESTRIDHWFLYQIYELVDMEESLKGKTLEKFTPQDMRSFKKKGFADDTIAHMLGVQTSEVHAYREQHHIQPVYKRIDSCAGEFSSETAYMYSTYQQVCEASPTKRDKIIILGSGPNRIGQGIEFDYCCVHAAQTIRNSGLEAIMVNCNPETVSTDFDVADRLYFEPVSLEDVLAIINKENPKGVIVQLGGQTPLKLAQSLADKHVPILGTTPKVIDWAEDRKQFQQVIHQLGLKQPQNLTALSYEEAKANAQKLGYPLVVRPSYVLGGKAMRIIYHEHELHEYLITYPRENNKPILLEKFLNDAMEVDVDAISDGEDVFIAGIMEHIEEAGVHSGDSSCALPPFSLSSVIQQELKRQVTMLATHLKIVGLLNVQFAIQHEDIYILELNPRASRTIPFVSKATGLPLVNFATQCMLGKKLKELSLPFKKEYDYYAIKLPVFPFNRFKGVDTLLGPEMRSTGEVMGIAKGFGQAFSKALLGAGIEVKRRRKAFVSVRNADKPHIAPIAKLLIELGFVVLATRGTAKVIEASGLAVVRVNKVVEGRPHIVDMIKNDEIDFIINTTEGTQAIADSYTIRQSALSHHVNYATTLAGAKAFCLSMKYSDRQSLTSLQSLT